MAKGFGRLFLLILLFAGIELWPGRATAQPANTSCETRWTDLDRQLSGSSTEQDFIKPGGLTAGDRSTLRWRLPKLLGPGAQAVFLLTVDRPVRVVSNESYALLPEARAPFDIATGKSLTRILSPLSVPHSWPSGTMKIRFLEAGRTALEWGVAARLSNCGERFLVLGKAVADIGLGPMKLVAPDRQTERRSSETWTSLDNRYLLEVFPDWFRVVTREDRATVWSAPGFKPRFSPTGRFLNYFTRDVQGEEEGSIVVDLYAREIIHRAGTATIGWAYQDSILLSDGFTKSGGGVTYIRNTILDNPPDQQKRRSVAQTKPVDFWLGGGCRACPSILSFVPKGQQSILLLDLDRDLLLGVPDWQDVSYSRSAFSFSNRQEREIPILDSPGIPWELLRPENKAKLHAFEAEHRRPQRMREKAHVLFHAGLPGDFRIPEGIALGDPVLFTSIGRGTKGLTLAPTMRRQPAGNAVEQPAQLGEMRMRSAVRWRGNATGEPDGLQAILRRIGLRTERAVIGESKEVYPVRGAQPPITETMGYSLRSRRIHADFIRPRWAKNEAVFFRREMPQSDARATPYCPLDEEETAGKKFRVPIDDIVRVWRWSYKDRWIWALHTLCYAGNAVVPHTFFHVVDVAEDGTAHPIGISKTLFSSSRDQFDSPWDDEGYAVDATRSVAGFFPDGSLLVTGNGRLWRLRLGSEAPTAQSWPVTDIQNTETLLMGEGDRPILVRRDGSFVVLAAESEATHLGGLIVDGEALVVRPDGRFMTTAEGENIGQIQFSGSDRLFLLRQFSSRLYEPSITSADTGSAEIARILPPPSLKATVRSDGDDLVVRYDVAGAQPLRELRLAQDGRAPRLLPLNGTRSTGEWRIPFRQGARWHAITAVDSAGQVSNVETHRLASRRPSVGRLLGLALGVDRYADRGLRPLRFAASDARRAAEAFRFSARQPSYRAIDVSVLTDAEASRSAVLDRLTSLLGRANEDDTVVLFFAGHGLKGPDGNFYLATTATDPHRLAETALSWSEVSRTLASSRARVIVFLDACHSGVVTSLEAASNDDALSAFTTKGGGTMTVITAAKGRETSLERDDLRAGVFTSALARILGTERRRFDRDGDGSLDLSELFAGLREQVARMSGGRQTPWLARNGAVGDLGLF